MITIVVDTTATFPDVMLSRTRWMQLLSLCARGQVAVVISEVVLRETARHWESNVSKSIDELRRAWGTVNRSLRKLGDLDFDINLEPLPEFSEPSVDQQDFIDIARNRLEDLRVEIYPLPNVAIEDLLQRDLSRRKPFSNTGKGFRDALQGHGKVA